MSELGEDEGITMPDEVEVSAPFLYKSIVSVVGLIDDVFKVMGDAKELNQSADELESTLETDEFGIPVDTDATINAAEDVQNDANVLKDDAKKLNDSLKSDGLTGFIALVVAIFMAFKSNIVLGIVYVALLGTVIVLPIVVAVRFIMALISMLIHLKNQGKAHSSCAKSFGAVLVMFPTLWLMKILAPQAAFSKNIMIILVLLIIGLAVNLIASRLKSYTPSQFRYINLLQGLSALSLVGYLVFMLNIGGMNMFGHLWDSLPQFIQNASKDDVMITYILIMGFASLLFVACKFVQLILCRMCCLVPVRKATKRHPEATTDDSYILTACISLATIVFPIILMFTSFKLSFGEDLPSFILFSVGIVIMFVSEILLLALKKKLGISGEDVHYVLTGYPTQKMTDEEAESADISEELVSEACEIADDVV